MTPEPLPPVTPESIRAAKIACNAERARIAALTGYKLPLYPIDDEVTPARKRRESATA